MVTKVVLQFHFFTFEKCTLFTCKMYTFAFVIYIIFTFKNRKFFPLNDYKIIDQPLIKNPPPKKIPK